ncbi:hypothetical protein [Rhodococcus sp. JS3073]|uniref:hypothetical protein n=1 Tax=Rhodococcus sp. JS3073 TaxID=3002901 RepID=UPI0022855F1C|nr:hypothetical protein [Rhodococcus sp. JS3073]WAM19430.1 hypothetical protein OYT95_44000 [Rhodococcus sp. JS3073]
MPKPHPEEFGRTSGSEESCLLNWLCKTDVEDGKRPGVSKDESDELGEACKRIRLLE